MGNTIIHISLFEKALYPIYSNYRLQAYYSIIIYLFLALALCGILATVAYLFSLSSGQDSEKRSEYECGFEPFDSATRLPFDVHFYLVGILFLIFDVEIALLFPWVLALRTAGWFGFYLMVAFILILAVGFLYEWKRGALIWPSRQTEHVYTAAIVNTAQAPDEVETAEPEPVVKNSAAKEPAKQMKPPTTVDDLMWESMQEMYVKYVRENSIVSAKEKMQLLAAVPHGMSYSEWYLSSYPKDAALTTFVNDLLMSLPMFFIASATEYSVARMFTIQSNLATAVEQHVNIKHMAYILEEVDPNHRIDWARVFGEPKQASVLGPILEILQAYFKRVKISVIVTWRRNPRTMDSPAEWNGLRDYETIYLDFWFFLVIITLWPLKKACHGLPWFLDRPLIRALSFYHYVLTWESSGGPFEQAPRAVHITRVFLCYVLFFIGLAIALSLGYPRAIVPYLIISESRRVVANITIPTAAIERKMARALQRIVKKSQRATAKVKYHDFKSAVDCFTTFRFFEKSLALHKKANRAYLNYVNRIATRLRALPFLNDDVISRLEKRLYALIAMSQKEYRKMYFLHRLLVKKIYKYRSSVKKMRNLMPLTVLNNKKNDQVLALLQKYIVAKIKLARGDRKDLLRLKRKLSSQLARQFSKRRGIRRRSFTSNHRLVKDQRAHKKARASAAFILAPLVTEQDSYPLQFIGGFLPEFFITLLITVTLLLLALELGQGHNKKELSLESLSALRFGFIAVVLMYCFQLFFSSSALMFNGYFAATTYTTLLKLLTVVSGQFILSNSEKYLRAHPRHLLEYPLILTLAVLFMLILVSSGHLISGFLTLVGFSLNLYVLVLFDANFAGAREAGIKYFYLSTVSSGLILYSVFMFFIVANTSHLYEINHFLSINPELLQASSGLLQLALILLLTGFFFKLSAFPGHLWAAEVYEGSPDPVTAFFMLPVKVAVLAFVVQLLAVAFEPLAALWQPLIVASASLSLVWGCLAAVSELKTKRFLAYASINQIGFLLMGVAAGSAEGYRATLFYLVLYALMNIGFLVVFLSARREDGHSLLYLTDFRGFGQRYGNYSWSVAMILLSMAGIPPLAGFFGKYYLLLHAQEQELYGLVIIALATSLISTYYYLRLIKIFWFEGTSGAMAVDCDLSWQQALLLRLTEWSLWTFIIYSGVVTYALDIAVEDLIVLNDFCTL